MGRKLTGLLLIGAALAAALISNHSVRAAATAMSVEPSSGSPLTCRGGAYVTSLHDANIDSGTFRADFWLWTVCPANTLQPLKTLEFVSADQVSTSFQTTDRLRGGQTYASEKVSGTFRHGYDLVRYPFDRQRLEIQIEDSQNDAEALRFLPDTKDTACAPGASLDDWTVAGCGLNADRHAYQTAFGDPNVSAASSTYSRLTLAIDLKRTDTLTEFLKQISIIYPAMLLTVISFFIMTEATNTLTARLSTAGAMLFAVSLAMRDQSSQLNTLNHFTLFDAIGVSALLCTVLAGATAMWCQRRLDGGADFDHVRSVSQRVGSLTGLAFLVINALLILYAVNS